MGSGASKSLAIPLVVAERNHNVAALRQGAKQKCQIPEPYLKIKPGYQKIMLAKPKPEQGAIKVIHGVVGLVNLGNTCYFNTAIHCLSHTAPLLDYFMSRVYEKEINKSNFGSKGQVATQLAQLLFDIWKDERCVGITDHNQYSNTISFSQRLQPLKNSANPCKLFQLVQKFSKRFEIGQQEDVQELLSYLLDIIHEDLNRCQKKLPSISKDYTGPEPKEEWAAESWGEHLKANRSIIVDLFQGQLKSTIKCMTCNYQSHKWEPFLFLNLPIFNKQSAKVVQLGRFESGAVPATCTLQECLELFQREEILEGNQQWKCTQCKQNRDCKKQIRIWKLPNILVIHLKRFEYGTRIQGKITTKVDFPVEQLDMSQFCVEQTNVTYSLYAVAQHHGMLHFGHYVAACKHRYDGSWYMYNDDEVFKIQDVQRNIINEHAYVLFYQRNTEEIMRQTTSDQKGWPHFQKLQASQLMDYGHVEEQGGGQMDFSPRLGQSTLMKPSDTISQNGSLTTQKSPGIIKDQKLTMGSECIVQGAEQEARLRQQWGLGTPVDKKIQEKTERKFVEMRAKGKNTNN